MLTRGISGESNGPQEIHKQVIKEEDEKSSDNDS